MQKPQKNQKKKRWIGKLFLLKKMTWIFVAPCGLGNLCFIAMSISYGMSKNFLGTLQSHDHFFFSVGGFSFLIFGIQEISTWHGLTFLSRV